MNQQPVKCPGCGNAEFLVDAKPPLWAVYCANNQCSVIIMDVGQANIIPLLYKKHYGDS